MILISAWHNRRPSHLTSSSPRVMYVARFRKPGSLIGLIAILMMALAPAVSQMMMSRHRLVDALTVYCSASVDEVSAAHDGKPSHVAKAHWQACPYCSFVAHATALPGHAVALAALRPGSQRPVVAASNPARISLVHTVAQSRAPPAFS
ncbi:DUF2946 domain-containing protein [Burkholderia sp. BCC0405]|uniref:DUF2946 domain-containing protein n=1 Tax=Burkholderia sp. BCC0405 TaxID=2676298 RepID=UPI00158A7159|nr:DUF2946 domain-containing protein [Burkholderia sp. BCC0405]